MNMALLVGYQPTSSAIFFTNLWPRGFEVIEDHFARRVGFDLPGAALLPSP
jgi:hypothetical protein